MAAARSCLGNSAAAHANAKIKRDHNWGLFNAFVFKSRLRASDHGFFLPRIANAKIDLFHLTRK